MISISTLSYLHFGLALPGILQHDHDDNDIVIVIVASIAASLRRTEVRLPGSFSSSCVLPRLMVAWCLARLIIAALASCSVFEK